MCDLQAQPYFQENINAGADDKYGLEQLLQQKASQASASQEAAATAAVVATASSASTADESAATAAAAAAAAAGLMPTGPEAAAVAAVAAEAVYPFLKGAAADRQAAAVALGPAGFAALLDKVSVCWWGERGDPQLVLLCGCLIARRHPVRIQPKPLQTTVCVLSNLRAPCTLPPYCSLLSISFARYTVVVCYLLSRLFDIDV